MTNAFTLGDGKIITIFFRGDNQTQPIEISQPIEYTVGPQSTIIYLPIILKH